MTLNRVWLLLLLLCLGLLLLMLLFTVIPVSHLTLSLAHLVLSFHLSLEFKHFYLPLARSAIPFTLTLAVMTYRRRRGSVLDRLADTGQCVTSS